MPEEAVRHDGGALWKVGTDSLRTLQAGLASLFLLFAALATFGPWFQITLAQVLTSASIVVGLAGLRWSHRASHSRRRNPEEAGAGFATAGWLASLFGIVVSGIYNGAILFVLHPLAIPIVILALLVFAAVHENVRTREAFFHGHVDPRNRTSVCARCGRRALISSGRWAAIGWTCGNCTRARKIRGARGTLRGILVLSVIAAALLVIPAVPARAFCEILEPPTDFPTEVKGTQIEIRLAEGFARVVIIKEFFNPSDRVKEGQVFFPLEKGHELITDLSLKIGNVVYTGSAQGRQGALDDFLTALANGKDAALVQYDTPRDVYWVAVTIPPKESRTTITTLEMPLTMRDGFYNYEYRLSVDARHSTEYLRLHLRVETSAPLEDVRTPTHPSLAIAHAGSHVAEAWINSTAESLRRDLTVQFRSSGASMGQFATTAVVHNATVPERYVRFSLDVGDAAFADSLRPLPRSFLILIDASGSMGLRGRWDLARSTARELARNLRAGETFAVAAFHGNTVFPLSPGLQRWGASSEDLLTSFLDSIHPRGSTGLTVALPMAEEWSRAAAARGQQPILFLLSDGQPTVSPVAPKETLETAYRRVSHDRNMPVFAFAMDPSTHSDESLLRNVSHFNRGDLVTVRPGGVQDSVREAVSEIRVPVLLGMRARFPGAANPVFASPNPQDLIQGGESFAIAKSTGTANDSVNVELSWIGPDGNGRAFVRTYAGSEITVQPLLKKTWVLTRIHALLETIAATRDPATIEELKTFATANRIVTPYTSILVSIPRRPPPGTPPGPPSTGSSNPFDLFTGGTLTGPGSSTLQGPSAGGGTVQPSITTPLDREAQETQSFWSDLRNPLVAEGEVDRFVQEGSPEHFAIEGRASVIRLQGQSLSIFEVDGELVGVYGARLDTANALGMVLWNEVLGSAALIMLFALVGVTRIARGRPGRKR